MLKVRYVSGKSCFEVIFLSLFSGDYNNIKGNPEITFTKLPNFLDWNPGRSDYKVVFYFSRGFFLWGRGVIFRIHWGGGALVAYDSLASAYCYSLFGASLLQHADTLYVICSICTFYIFVKPCRFGLSYYEQHISYIKKKHFYFQHSALLHRMCSYLSTTVN